VRRLLAAILFVSPAPAIATCIAGGTPSYQDITYIRVRQYSLVGILHPRYEFEAISVSAAGSQPARATASLSAHRAVPYFGNFVAMNPKQSFDDVAAVLERSRFFDMRMAAPKCCVIDGPEDSITVIRCNVTTTLATVSEGGLANLEDAQSKVFLRLEDLTAPDDLRREMGNADARPGLGRSYCSPRLFTVA